MSNNSRYFAFNDGPENFFTPISRIYNAENPNTVYVPGEGTLHKPFLLITASNIVDSRAKLEGILSQRKIIPGIVEEGLIGEGIPINLYEASTKGLLEVGSSAEISTVGYLFLEKSKNDFDMVKKILEQTSRINGYYGYVENEEFSSNYGISLDLSDRVQFN